MFSGEIVYRNMVLERSQEFLFFFPLSQECFTGIPVGQELIRFDLPDDRVRHWVRRECTPLDLLSGHQAEKLVSPLQVSSGTEHYCRGGASHHGVRWRRFIMNLTLRPEW